MSEQIDRKAGGDEGFVVDEGGRDRIRGRVARVNSDRELIINRGEQDGVEEGMLFAVKDAPVEVVDPDTQEVLGAVSPVKVVVRAEEVSERFSIARTFRTRRVLVESGRKGGSLHEALGAGTSLNRLLQPPLAPKYETRVETLRLDPERGKPLSPQESAVNVGDDVESLLPDDNLDPVTTTLFR